jgi:hypothetical protein
VTGGFQQPGFEAKLTKLATSFDVVGRCRLSLSKPELKARLV